MIDEIFSYKFKDTALLKKALTHTSASNSENYQTLEFLGDRILSQIIAEYLFKTFTKEREKSLARRHSALVCSDILLKIALDNELSNYVIVGKGEDNLNINESILSDCVESIIAAIYLDSNDMNIIKHIVLDLWKSYLNDMVDPPHDVKSKLQEYLQKKGLELPHYKVISVEGSSHEPIFTVELSIEGYEKLRASAKSKRMAEKKLAKKMINIIDSKIND